MIPDSPQAIKDDQKFGFHLERVTFLPAHFHIQLCVVITNTTCKSPVTHLGHAWFPQYNALNHFQWHV